MHFEKAVFCFDKKYVDFSFCQTLYSMMIGVYLDRLIAVKLKESLELFPVCVVTGADKQRSTLLRHELPQYTWPFDDRCSEIFSNQIPSDFWVP